jgi:hypothetical protein
MMRRSSKANPPEAGKPQNIEYRITKAEGGEKRNLISSFEIPCSTFDIRVSGFQFARGHKPAQENGLP